jgi:NAD(P)-dependent dehydrogenase (short-subunit alcohol dehydrogenase family)
MGLMADDRLELAEQVKAATRLLRSLVEDRTRLASIDESLRHELLKSAGELSRPDRQARRALQRAFRRHDRTMKRTHDEKLLAATGMRSAQRTSIFVAPPPALPPVDSHEDGPELVEPRDCYVCKASFRKLHSFYDSMCPPCAALNYEKRHQAARLDGQVALVTGARVKIGYQTALMLLRAGACVLVTTRFPRDAARRFSREDDFGEFSGRLQIYGLDLRHLPSVERFARHLEETLDRLDILINNAAQTVRRPPAFYSHLMEAELAPLELVPGSAKALLSGHTALAEQLSRASQARQAGSALLAFRGEADESAGLLESARLSQIQLVPGDDLGGEAFPFGLIDHDLQQVDLRPMNSWRLPLDQVSTPELLEVHLVNAIAPFILNSRLRAVFRRRPADPKHIVNVSAMEAQFSRHKKTDKHPHTNMAKAALNMMTRTSAVDYATDRIYMNSVDTGWVTDEDPLHHVARKERIHGFHPPLDIVDGAARVLDPILSGTRTGQHPWGLFFKDYRPVAW